MKYPPYPISARPFLSTLDINNRWIWGNCRHVINVSLKDQSDEVKELICAKGCTYDWIPMTENEEFDSAKFELAVARVLSYARSFPEDEIIVHCTGGNNRSRMVCETVIHALSGSWPIDRFEVDGITYDSHMDYNIKKGYLTSLQ